MFHCVFYENCFICFSFLLKMTLKSNLLMIHKETVRYPTRKFQLLAISSLYLLKTLLRFTMIYLAAPVLIALSGLL